jgi:hypothetical protein
MYVLPATRDYFRYYSAAMLKQMDRRFFEKKVTRTYVGVFGAIFFMCTGSYVADFAARKAYRKALPKEKSCVEEREELVEHTMSKLEIAQKAADKFGVNLNSHSFEEAHIRFRKMLLAAHPDKHPNASAEHLEELTAETRDIIACWGIVRLHYAEAGAVAECEVDETFVTTTVLYAWDAALNGWKVVRSWCGNIGLGRNIDPATERLDQVTIYL